MKDPINLINNGLTEMTNNIVELKNNVNNSVRNTSSNILGPFADVFDYKWLTRKTTKNGNTTERINKIFNGHQILEEIKSSIRSKISCLTCKFIIHVVKFMIKTGKNDTEILSFIDTQCSVLQIQTPRVCTGVMNLIGVDVVEIIKLSDMTSAQICNFVLDNSCLNGYDARHNWELNLPLSTISLTHPQSPPSENVPMLKVLQISDTHFDPYYQEGANANCNEPLCCRATNGFSKNHVTAAGKWGDYRKCDTPRRLLDNVLQHIAVTHKDIDYIIWTGDLPPHDIWNQTKEENLKNLQVTCKLIATYFEGIPIFPSVGNHESCPVDSYAPAFAPPRKSMSWLYDQLSKEWSRWLPADTFETIRRGAFYSVLVKPKFRIISINGNYCSRNNFWLLLNSTDPMGELTWLVHELNMAEAKREKVHIIGHIPPGQPDCLKIWSKNYYNIINRYEGTIMAQFYGHTHYDEFEIFYDTKDFKRAINVGYIAPSITPWENVNPAYRIYYIDGDHSETTRLIIDHETWTMNLYEANKNDDPKWYKAYSAKDAYLMTSVLPKDWDNLVNRMVQDKDLFEKYHRNYYRNSTVRPACNNECKRKSLCNLRCGRSYDQQNLCRDLYLKIQA
ncbi:PREDICTED: sphingomyelin phosphodiesterase-like [Ceratosolen solmsi marchali]|uniref:Sphingomyelin phosphodiesterase n=1 Tax=Ceratosolen solmsi marchali TaxID=326594 RepID=A0AAJ6YN98_9HYME|nr:PREDICTED: sphingomyelin phosphodiesterase-like [Ceratosolen solmsi marchali]